MEVHFADEEGDPYAVELAGRMRGYVAGRDSDFVVLNSEGYLGYLPLDELLWIREVEEPIPEVEGGADDGFTTVVKGKSRKRGVQGAPASVFPNDSSMKNGKAGKTRTVTSIAGNGMIPPEEDLSSLTLTACVYKPSTLAQLFSLPISVLPLVGAFVGNDYTLQAADTPSDGSPSASYNTSSKESFQRLLFPRSLSLSQRITHAATTLSAFLRPHTTLNAQAYTGKRKLHRSPQSAMELIQWTVGALLASGGAPASMVTSGREDLIAEAIVQGTLPYALPLGPLDDVSLDPGICALHEPEECQLAVSLDTLAGASATMVEVEGGRVNASGKVAELYLRAYRAGLFSPLLMDVVSTRTFWPEIFLEHPDHEAVARSVSRPIRAITYAVLENALGLPIFADDLEEEGQTDVAAAAEVRGDVGYDGDPDELIDVVEEHSDDEIEEEESDFDEDVTRLRGALRNLQYENGPSSSIAESESSAALSIAEAGPDDGFPTSKGSISQAYAKSPERPIEGAMAALRRRWPNERPKVVTEYVRRGTRVIGEEVEVSPIGVGPLSTISLSDDETNGVATSSKLPLPLLPFPTRFAALCSYLHTPPQILERITSHSRMAVLAMRHILRRMHARALDAGLSKEKQLGRWTRRECRAFLACLAPPASAQSRQIGSSTWNLTPPEDVSERSIQLTAQVSTTLEALEHLTQVLFLTSEVPGCVHRFSGRRFHALLSFPLRNADEDFLQANIDSEIWSVVEDDLGACFAEERGAGGKKARKKAREAAAAEKGAIFGHLVPPSMSRSSSAQSGRSGMVGAQSIYSLLADADM